MPSSNPTVGGAVDTAPVFTKTSGRRTVGERNTLVTVQHGKYSHLELLLPRKGDLTTDGYAVVSAELEKDGVRGVLTITYEPVFAVVPGSNGGGLVLPPDTWSLRPTKTDAPIETHPAWAALSAPHKTWWKLATGDIVNPRITADLARAWIAAYGSSDMKEMFAIKERQGTFPITYWTYTWTQTKTFVPPLSDGNVIETPFGPGAPYLGGGLTWKRETDILDAPGNGLFVVTREWVGAPTALGGWNSWLF
jgi:hypothetical protein